MFATEKRTEQYRTKGEKLVARVRELVREGNVRRITIRNEDGRPLIEVPLTVGVVGAVLVPTWAALAAIAAIVTDCSIEVERAAASSDEEPEPRVTRPVGLEHEVDTEC
jgi:hypothetical protein